MKVTLLSGDPWCQALLSVGSESPKVIFNSYPGNIVAECLTEEI